MFGFLLLFTTPMLTPGQDRCPHVTISADSQPGGRIGFTGMVQGGDPNVTPTFNWTISEGTLASGQGSSTIQVEAEPGLNVTASLEVGGYDSSCTTMASETEQAMPAAAPDCPLLMIVSDSPAPGKGIFGAQLFPEPPGVDWKWSISEGKIVRGQGTGRIDIEAAPGHTVTGSIAIAGAPAGCTLSEKQDLSIK